MKNWNDFTAGEKPEPYVADKLFVIAAVGLDHGHIYSMCREMINAGAVLKYVYDRDRKKSEAFAGAFPGCEIADSYEQILADDSVKLICNAGIPDERYLTGIQCMEAGKDYLTDKPALTSLAQLDAVKDTVARTGKKYMCDYSERLHSEAGELASRLIEAGAIGRVIHIDGFGPHRIGRPESRPDWFYEKERYGGILCDIGSHQIEQFLYYCGCKDAAVQYSQVGNYNHKSTPGLEDFGDCTLFGDNGATMHFRVDWFTPDGLSTWGDGRTFIVGTDGYIEMRKYCQVGAGDGSQDHLYLVNHDGEFHFSAAGMTGLPFFSRFIHDCVDRTETAMSEEHCLTAARLCVEAEMRAVKTE